MTNSHPAPGIEKICKVCKQPASDSVVFGFHKYKLKNRISYSERSTCRSCEARIAREYMAGNKNKRVEAKRKHREKNYGTIKYHVQEKISTWRKVSSTLSDLTVEYLIDLYNRQDGYCYYTKEKMIFGWIDGKISNNSLSLDKLDPSKGYVKGNVVWCSYLVNTMKQNMNENQFYDYMKMILQNKFGVI